MRSAFSRMFWGYLLTLIEIHFIFFDILADPIGYYFIFSGITSLVKDYPVGKKASNIAVALIFLSIPTVFIQQSEMIGGLGLSPSMVSAWTIYHSVLSIVNLILLFYIFQLMMAIARDKGDDYLITSTSKTFKSVMMILLIYEIIHPFTINFTGDEIMMPGILAIIIVIITQIVFLVLLRRFMHINEENLINKDLSNPVK